MNENLKNKLLTQFIDHIKLTTGDDVSISIKDELIGLYNHSCFYNFFDEKLYSEKLSIIFLNIDLLKKNK